MNKLRLLAAILVFGSLWGFSEVLIGSPMSDLGLPSGAIMTGFFALTSLALSRLVFKQPGMQLGMGLVAGGLRMFNPFMGCHLCSAIAITAEAIIFEIIWYSISLNSEYLKKPLMQASIGVITGFSIYVGGYITTQILTPIAAGAAFYIENLIVFLPKILAGGLLPSIVAGILLPIIILSKKLDITLKDRIYYPVTLGITILCWFITLGNWFLA